MKFKVALTSWSRGNHMLLNMAVQIRTLSLFLGKTRYCAKIKHRGKNKTRTTDCSSDFHANRLQQMTQEKAPGKRCSIQHIDSVLRNVG